MWHVVDCGVCMVRNGSEVVLSVPTFLWNSDPTFRSVFLVYSLNRKTLPVKS